MQWGCVKGCVRATRRKEKDLRKVVDKEGEKAWVPKEGDRVDFLVGKNNFFVKAYVKKVM